MIDSREPNRNYKVPNVANTIAEDFPRVGDAIAAIGVDVAGLLTSVAGRALLSHNHAIADVTGLQTALDGKHPNTWRPSLDDLTDVNAPSPTSGQVLTRVGSQWQPAAVTIDASAIASGTIDPARIPVLTGQAPIVSSGALVDLSSPQQAQIIAGTVVVTTDGFRWVYTGAGDKTLSASYIALADVTPEWAAVANKPADIVNITSLLAAKAALAGNTFTGDQTISKATPLAIFNKTASGQNSGLQFRTAGLLRWNVLPSDGAAESGGNAGSNFGVSRFNDAGDYLGDALTIRRSDGYTTIAGVLEVGTANAGHSLLAKRHSDAGTVGGLLQLENTPGSAMVGNLQIRQSGNGLQIIEGGGTQRGVNLQITNCPAGAGGSLIHSGNLGASMGNLGAGAVGNYGFMRVDTAANPGDVRAGNTLRWSDHSAHSSGSTVNGSWIILGHAIANGHVTAAQRIA